MAAIIDSHSSRRPVGAPAPAPPLSYRLSANYERQQPSRPSPAVGYPPAYAVYERPAPVAYHHENRTFYQSQPSPMVNHYHNPPPPPAVQYQQPSIRYPSPPSRSIQERLQQTAGSRMFEHREPWMAASNRTNTVVIESEPTVVSGTPTSTANSISDFRRRMEKSQASNTPRLNMERAAKYAESVKKLVPSVAGKVFNHSHCHMCRTEARMVINCCRVSDHAVCPAHLKSGFNLNWDEVTANLETLFTICPICSMNCPCQVCAKKIMGESEMYEKWLSQQQNNEPQPVQRAFIPRDAPRKHLLSETVTSEPKRIRVAEDKVEQQLSEAKEIEYPTDEIVSKPQEEDDEAEPDAKHVVDQIKVAAKTLMHETAKAVVEKTADEVEPPKSTRRRSTRGRGRRGTKKDDESESEEASDSNFDSCNVCDVTGNLLCCDKCPRAYHMDCLKISAKDLPDGDWQCSACQELPPDFEKIKRLKRNKAPLKKICKAILDALLKHDLVGPFEHPVKGVPEYRNVIDQPMDLETMSKKIDRYESIESMTLDMELIRDNCHTFNNVDSAITRMVDSLFQAFKTLAEL